MDDSHIEWFPDLQPWPEASGTPARGLADALVTSGRVPSTATTSTKPERPAPAPAEKPRPARPSPPAAAARPPSPPPSEPHPSEAPPEPSQPRDRADDDYLPEPTPVGAESRSPRSAEAGDDPFEQMRVRAVTKKPEPGPAGLLKTRRGPLIGAAAAVVVIAIAAAITATQIGGKSGNKPSTAAGPTSTQQPSQSSAAPGAASCPSSVKGAVTTGNGPGDQNSGVGTIMAFEHAYYVTRSAKAARAVALPDAVAKEPDMQYFIDRRPPGTTYCLTITDRGRGAYSLQMTESPPGQPQTVYHQAIQTVESGHKHWIQSIKDQ